ncbi:MAG: hypothetical protein BAA01_06300 [Bacillus thermozeamaize]|uniref:Cytochrome c oxidase assembly factor CtaG n=1 Tax=Bacillus thermozeamaize TaxID=230954 RepID=A0A1Y3PEH9_9BACI|nr:MAG: hypothetical protein BAA01_06300 [Bacillus thermozeamaize]
MAVTFSLANLLTAPDPRLWTDQKWCGGIPLTPEIMNGSALWSAWSIPWLLAVLAILGWYIAAARGVFLKNPPGDAGRVPKRKMVSFFLGMALFYLAVGSPLHIIGHFFLFSIHMLTMAVLYFIVPPLILYGMTDRMYRSVLSLGILRGVYAFFSRRASISLVLFNLLLSFYHFPFIFEFFKEYQIAGSLIHSVLFFTAMMNWLPIVQTIDEFPRLSEGKKIVYLFVDGLALMPACVLILFSGVPLYESYAGAPQLVPWLSKLSDQQLGSIFMILIQEIVYMIVLAMVIYQWARREQQVTPEVQNLILLEKASGRLRN